MRRHRMSLRLHAGEDVGRSVMMHPGCFQRGMRSAHASRVWIDAVASRTTVLCWMVLPNAAQQASTTPGGMDGATLEVGKACVRFITPHPVLLPYCRAGSAIMLPASGQADGIAGARANPAASNSESARLPWSSCCCRASRARGPRAQATGARRLVHAVRPRCHRRRARLARRVRDALRRRFAGCWGSRSPPCVRDRGSALRSAMARVCSARGSVGGLPLRGGSWRRAGPSRSQGLRQGETVARSTCERVVLALLVSPAARRNRRGARVRARGAGSGGIGCARRARWGASKGWTSRPVGT